MREENKNAILNKDCHSRVCRPQDSGIYDACSCVRAQQTACVEDPRLQASGMTTLLNNTPSSALTGHLPPRGEAAHFNAPSTLRERVECVSTGVRGKRAFTLIELLVVVLIIGILAAVALPQYQLAVKKAQVMQVIAAAKALQSAEELFYLANGTYTSNLEDLDIKFQLPAGWVVSLAEESNFFDNRDVFPYLSVTTKYIHSEGKNPGKIYCWANNTDTTRQSQKICQAVGQQEIEPAGGGRNWLIGS